MGLAEDRLAVIRLLMDIIDSYKPSTTKDKLLSMGRKADIENLLEESTLSDLQKEIVRRRYELKQDFLTIGTQVGYSERRVRDLHQEALKIISGII